ncbi:MAG: dTDP-4-dehydrorhamnose 3,5-epimerase family protein [Desulfovibrio sp.]|nr:dTDP-4-dehydrorhamnose 3,5-epimerase family protein [Desulfovibrio sp.]
MDQIETILEPTGIEGAFTQQLDILDTKGGPVLHMLRPSMAMHSHLVSMGKSIQEIYFSEVLPKAVKGWKRHHVQQQLFAVPFGRILVVLYDGRRETKSSGKVVEVVLGRPNYRLLTIPPMVWYAFAAATDTPSILCNAVDIPHNPEESDRKDLNDPGIPYRFQA